MNTEARNRLRDRPRDRLLVTVAFGLPRQQVVRSITVPAGATVADAIEASGIEQALATLDPGYDIGSDRVGIFGRRARLDETLRDGDRVELYRPLVADPKEARRARAEAERRKAGKRPPKRSGSES